MLGEYFHEHFGLANSFAMAGSSVGIIFLGPLTQIFVELYGWRGAMLLVGALVSHIIVFGALLRPPTKLLDHYNDYLLKDSEEDFMTDEQECDPPVDNSCKAWCLSIFKTIDCSLFRDPLFIIIAIVSTTIRYSQMAWLIYLVPNVVSKGVPDLKASFVATTAGAGDIIGRLLPGVFSSCSVQEVSISSKTVWTAGMCILALSFALDALMESYTAMMVLGIFQGLGLGMTYSSTNVVLYDEFGKDRLVNAMGWVRGFGGVGRLIGGVVPGK